VGAQGSPETLTEVMEQLAAVFPSIVRPLIAERDEYMACRLRALAPKCAARPRPARARAPCCCLHRRGVRQCLLAR
jgi:pheromone shutdown protein TraB